MTSLTTLWDSSLLLCAIALAAVMALFVARVVDSVQQRRREAMRRKLLPAMIRGTAIECHGSRLARKVIADLTVDMVGLVRGSDRSALIASAEATSAPQELARRLRSRATKDRLTAAETLAMFPDYVSEVSRAVLGDHNADVRLGAALALAREGRAPPVSDLIRQLGIGRSENSLLAISLMRDLVRTDPDGVKALLYDHEVPDAAKLSAIDAMAESGMVEHVPLVARMAEAASEDSDFKPRLYRALGCLRHPGGHNAILGGLESASWESRAAAAHAAGQSGLTAAVPMLAVMLGEMQWWVSFRAGEALANLGKEGREALQHATKVGSPRARTAASTLIGEKGLG